MRGPPVTAFSPYFMLLGSGCDVHWHLCILQPAVTLLPFSISAHRVQMMRWSKRSTFTAQTWMSSSVPGSFISFCWNSLFDLSLSVLKLIERHKLSLFFLIWTKIRLRIWLVSSWRAFASLLCALLLVSMSEVHVPAMCLFSVEYWKHRGCLVFVASLELQDNRQLLTLNQRFSAAVDEWCHCTEGFRGWNKKAFFLPDVSTWLDGKLMLL